MSDCLDICHGCPSTRFAPCARNKGEVDVAIVLDHPTSLEQAKKKLLCGDTGTLASKVLKAVGIDPNECYITTALNCRPNTKKEAMMKRAMLGCRDRLVTELKKEGITKVLCLGTVGFSALISAERNLPITKVRGKWHKAFGMDVLPTFNPTMVLGEPDYFRDFRRDVEKFARTHEHEPWPNVKVLVPENFEELDEAFDLLSEASFVSCDVESTGFSAYRDKLLAVGFGALFDGSTDGIEVIIDEALLTKKKTWRHIARLLSRRDQATVFHNAKFDLKFLMAYLRLKNLPYDPQNIQDTMLLNYCLDERPMGRFQAHSLKNIARVRYDAPDYDIEMGKWLKAWAAAGGYDRRAMREQMHEYLALDCYYTSRLYPDLLDAVISEATDLFALYETLLMPGTLSLAEIEFHGAKIDRRFFEEKWDELQARAAPILEKARTMTGNEKFNPNSPKQVKEYIYDELGLPATTTARRGKLQEGPTSKQVLKILKKKYPEHTEIIDAILEYRNLTKNAGTYVKGLLDRADDDDRIRGDFLPHGTATGRLSSTNPNLQNIPEASHTGIEVRNGYIAPEGKLLGNADYSQLELRMAAHLSGDQEFIQVYVDGRDLHQEVAFEFFQKPKELVTPYERYMAKCMNFGVVYGRGAHSLAYGPEMDYIEDELGGDRWTLSEVAEFFDKFFAKFERFGEWMNEQAAVGYKEQVVVSPLGRRRRFPFIPRGDNGAVGRQAINTPVQGTASDFTFSALIRIHTRFKELNTREEREIAHIVITVHDSIMFEFDPEFYDEIAEIVKEEMEEHCPIISPVPFKSDLEVAPKWGQMKDFDFEAYQASQAGTYA